MRVANIVEERLLEHIPSTHVGLTRRTPHLKQTQREKRKEKGKNDGSGSNNPSQSTKGNGQNKNKPVHALEESWPEEVETKRAPEEAGSVGALFALYERDHKGSKMTDSSPALSGTAPSA
eukprot:333806-Amphidinium_carterae.3